MGTRTVSQKMKKSRKSGLKYEKEGVVFLEAVVNGVPAGEHGDEADERRHHDEKHAETIDSDVVGRAQGRNPLRLFHELEVLGGVEVGGQRNGNQEAGEESDIGPQLDSARVRRRNEQQHQHAD